MMEYITTYIMLGALFSIWFCNKAVDAGITMYDLVSTFPDTWKFWFYGNPRCLNALMWTCIACTVVFWPYFLIRVLIRR